MAGTLLHLTLADAALHRNLLPETVVALADARPDDYHLGAVLVDLPFFENLIASGIRLLAKKELHLGVWGDLFHIRSPRTVCQQLLSDAVDDAGRALALGFLTHMAVDRIFHKVIEHRVLSVADGSRGLNNLHKQIEDNIDLHVHLNLLGHSGIGTRYARDALALRPHPQWMERFRRAVVAAHGAAPTERQLRSWLRELALFGILNASPLPPWTHTEAGGDESLREIALDLADEGVRLAGDYLRLGWEILQGEKEMSALASGIPDLNLAKGEGEAAPPVT